MKTSDLLQFIEDGQRAFRLRYSIRDCPNYDEVVCRKAWRAGYYSARDKLPAIVALETLAKELN